MGVTWGWTCNPVSWPKAKDSSDAIADRALENSRHYHSYNVRKTANMSKWSISYFNARVKREVEAWPTSIYVDYLRLAQLIEKYGIDLRMPHSRALGEGLFELRFGGRDGIGRALYCFVSNKEVVILHGFVKKTQKTPAKDIAIARARVREVRARS